MLHPPAPAEFDSQDENHRSASGSRSGWHRFRDNLIACGIKHSVHPWYARHAREFLCKIDNSPSELTCEQVEEHLLQARTVTTAR